MSASELATVILMLCGDNDVTCQEYYANCVVDKSVTLTVDNIEKCKDDYAKGVERIRKLREEEQ